MDIGCSNESTKDEILSVGPSQLFPKSLLLHFPSEIYLRRGVGELFALLVRALHEKEIVAMQFLRGGRVRVTVRSEAYREALLSSKFRFEDTVVPVTPADCVARSVYVRDLPFEVSDKSIVSVFSTYGKVYSVKSVYHNEFPAICTGTRTVLMSVNDPVPSVVKVHDLESRVWCPGQPAFCSVCRSTGLLPRACPLSGLCRRCKQPAHVARECGQAWGQPRPSSSASVPSPSSSPVDPVPDPVSTPSHLVPVPLTDPVPDDPSAPAPASVPLTRPLLLMTILVRSMLNVLNLLLLKMGRLLCLPIIR